MNPSAKRPAPAVSIDDYRRLHQVISAVLRGANPAADPAQASVLYAVVGTHLLRQVHKLEAAPVAGAALYRIGPQPQDVLSLGHADHGRISSSPNAFHCWIECDGWVIDLMAPLFPEMAARTGAGTRVPQQMFQKREDAMAKRPEDLRQAGDFHLVPDTDLTVELLGRFAQTPGNIGLVQVCKRWYRRAPQPIQGQWVLEMGEGRTVEMRLAPLALEGAW